MTQTAIHYSHDLSTGQESLSYAPLRLTRTMAGDESVVAIRIDRTDAVTSATLEIAIDSIKLGGGGFTIRGVGIDQPLALSRSSFNSQNQAAANEITVTHADVIAVGVSGVLTVDITPLLAGFTGGESITLYLKSIPGIPQNGPPPTTGITFHAPVITLLPAETPGTPADPPSSDDACVCTLDVVTVNGTPVNGAILTAKVKMNPTFHDQTLVLPSCHRSASVDGRITVELFRDTDYELTITGDGADITIDFHTPDAASAVIPAG